MSIATIIIPTHNHPSTLDLAVHSVLNQTVNDIEVVIIGDGVLADTRSVAHGLTRTDPRVSFLDLPKSISRAEDVRDRVIRSSSSHYIGYHGDDDLLLSTHLEEMIFMLSSTQSQFASPLPVFAREDGSFFYLPADLSMRECLDWHMKPGHNAVSLTGVVHTRESYMNLAVGWQAPPVGVWSDHFMWQQFFSLPNFKACTLRRATTIKTPHYLRSDWHPDRRRQELLSWLNFMQTANFRSVLDDKVFEAIRVSSIEQLFRVGHLENAVAMLQNEAASRETQSVGLRGYASKLRRRLASCLRNKLLSLVHWPGIR